VRKLSELLGLVDEGEYLKQSERVHHN
jgi:hypothetical protein